MPGWIRIALSRAMGLGLLLRLKGSSAHHDVILKKSAVFLADNDGINAHCIAQVAT